MHRERHQLPHDAGLLQAFPHPLQEVPAIRWQEVHFVADNKSLPVLAEDVQGIRPNAAREVQQIDHHDDDSFVILNLGQDGRILFRWDGHVDGDVEVIQKLTPLADFPLLLTVGQRVELLRRQVAGDAGIIAVHEGPAAAARDFRGRDIRIGCPVRAAPEGVAPRLNLGVELVLLYGLVIRPAVPA